MLFSEYLTFPRAHISFGSLEIDSKTEWSLGYFWINSPRKGTPCSSSISSEDLTVSSQCSDEFHQTVLCQWLSPNVARSSGWSSSSSSSCLCLRPDFALNIFAIVIYISLSLIIIVIILVPMAKYRRIPTNLELLWIKMVTRNMTDKIHNGWQRVFFVIVWNNTLKNLIKNLFLYYCKFYVQLFNWVLMFVLVFFIRWVHEKVSNRLCGS